MSDSAKKPAKKSAAKSAKPVKKAAATKKAASSTKKSASTSKNQIKAAATTKAVKTSKATKPVSSKAVKPKASAKQAPAKSAGSITKAVTYLKALRINRLVRFAVLWVVAYAVLLSFYFGTLMRNFTYLEVFPRELLFPFALHALTATVLALAVFWLPWLKHYYAKLITVFILVLMTTGYDVNLAAVSSIVRAFTPGLTDSSQPIVSLIYSLMLLVIGVLLGIGIERLFERYKRVKPWDIQLGMYVLAAYLFLLPAYSVARVLPTIIHESGVQPAAFSKAQTVPDTTPVSDKPDIYYIVLDRYTNATTLQQQFNYDNTPFTGFLRDNNFTVNDEAYGNYPYTTMSISSTLNAQYTNKLVAPYKDNAVQSRALYHNLAWQSSTVKALKQDGYKYYAIGAWYGATYKAPLADDDYMWEHRLTTFGFKKRIRGMEAVEFLKSPFYPLTKFTASWWPFKSEDHDRVSDVRQQLQILNDLTTSQTSGGRLIFAHILVPHPPFDFNADGSLSTTPNSDNVGKSVKQKYIGQVQFINSQIKQIVDNIQEQSSGKAVVILNADEGPYPQYQNSTFMRPQTADPETAAGMFKGEDMRTWPDDWLKMKYGVLQAVHIPRATDDDLAHLASVNIFRIILNRYAGYKLDYLPNCHYGLSSGMQNEYNYVDLTDKFTDNPDPSCKQMQSLPVNLKPPADGLQT